ncbi:GNAT family N-acetyltransferase [Labrys okinawensis]|uniref:GNAT family N-acetyltransferase n=1 Tax=Labrys okinawensis TaxID=346911 RepID=UPI0039BCBE8B
MIVLRSATPQEAIALSDLCLRSKAVWGYDDAFLRACRDERTLSADDISTDEIQVADVSGALAGVIQIRVDGGTAILDKLFVDPAFQGKGVGRTLYDWGKSRAAKAGASILMIEADPEAASSYRRMGARDVGAVASSSIPGRLLPLLRASLR